MTGHETYLGWSTGNPKDTLLCTFLSIPFPHPPQSSPLGSHGVCRVYFEAVALELLDA